MNSAFEHLQVLIENTPNPQTLVFRFSEPVLRQSDEQSYNFENVAETSNSPLAAKLFGFPWTSQILLGRYFISVTKQDWVDWEVLQEPLRGLIEEHLRMGYPVLIDTPVTHDEEAASDSPIVREIKKVIAREIRPVVALDGGDIAFVSFENGILALRFKGACSGCASQQVTLKEGIEVRLREQFSEVREVISV